MGRHARAGRTVPALVPLRILLRQFRAHLGSWIGVASVVLVLAFAATSAPLALQRLTVAEVASQLDDLPPGHRSLVGTADGRPHLTRDGFGELLAALDRVRDDAAQPLRQALGSPQFIGTSEAVPARPPGATDPSFTTSVTVNIAPDLERRVRLDAGSFPAPFATTDARVEVVLSTEAAEAMAWPVGESRRVGLETASFDATLSGTFSARDPGAEYWALAPDALSPVIASSFIREVTTHFVTGAAFIDAESLRSLPMARDLDFVTTAGFPVKDIALTGGEYQELAGQLARFSQQEVALQFRRSDEVAWSFSFGSQSPEAINEALDRVSMSSAVLTLVASGPVGVGAATLWMLSSLVVGRRRESLALLRARGAGPGMLRLLLACEASILVLPAALLGALAAQLAFPVSDALPAPGALAVVAAVLLALGLATSNRSLSTVRSDLRARDRRRPRLIAEGILFAATTLSVSWLVQRGLTTNVAETGIDPVLAAAPVLLAMSVGAVVLRLYPAPLLAVFPLLRSSRRFPTFFGVLRAIREPSLGAVAVFALLLGVSVTVFSLLMVTTLRDGIRDAAVSRAGADLRLAATAVSEDQLSSLTSVPGVAAAVAVYEFDATPPGGGGTAEGVTVVMADTATLARVQQGVPGAPDLPGDLAALRSGAIPAIYSTQLDRRLAGATLTVAGWRLAPTGTPSTMMAFTQSPEWVLVDSAFAESLGREGVRSRVVLADIRPRTDAAQLASATREILGDSSTASTPQSLEQRAAGSPVASGITIALVAGAVLVTLLCTIVFAAAVAITSSSRRRMLSLLGLLGLSRSQGRRVVAWELGLPALVWTVVGGVLGVVLALVVLAGVDLRSYTGGADQPAAVTHPLLVAGATGAFLAAVLAAASVVMLSTRPGPRRPPRPTGVRSSIR